MARENTLIQANSLVHKSALVLGGSLLIAIAAQISVPMYPVPMTLQTLAILLVGFALIQPASMPVAPASVIGHRIPGI